MPKVVWPPCYVCGKPSLCVTCIECQKKTEKAGRTKCPHGRDLGNCTECDVDGDLAHDSIRERRS